MASELRFDYFPYLPFELREMIWENAVALPTSQSTNPALEVSWSSTSDDSVEIARGSVLTYHTHGSKLPVIAHACTQARAVALKHYDSRCGNRKRDSVSVSSAELGRDVMVDAVLLKSLSPRAFVGRNNLARVARALHLAIPIKLFTKQGAIPMYLYELMAARKRVSAPPSMIVIFEFTIRLARQLAVESGIFGPNAEERRQLVDVNNAALMAKFAAIVLAQGHAAVWQIQPAAGVADVQGLLSCTSRERLVRNILVPVEDMWLDYQFAASSATGPSRTEVKARGGGSRYERANLWVQGALNKMPRFSSAVLFSLEVV